MTNPSETAEDSGPSPASMWTLGTALEEIERLRALVIHYADQCGVPEQEARRVCKL